MVNRRSVYKTNGRWAHQDDNSERVLSLHNTQAEAIAAARRMLARVGGGEISIHGEDGKIRAKDTVPPANDPNPPKG